MYVKKRLLSFKYALKGIMVLFTTQANALLHLAALIAVVAAGFIFGISYTEWAILSLACGLVISMEAANTAIESLTDLVSPEFHPLAGRAKDVAAGAVLIAALFAVAVGLFIFLPKF